MKGQTVDIRVGKVIKEFILCANHASETIFPKKGSTLFCIIKQYIEPTPGDWTPISDRSEYVRIIIPYTHGQKSYNIKSKKVKYINTSYMNYLPPKGEAAIKRYLHNIFKSVYRNYMFGAISNGSGIKISTVIEGFCRDYNITNDNITTEMLRKDWQRHKKDNKREKIDVF